MGAIAFDTYKFIKKLEKSGFKEEQAEALSEAIKEIQDAHLETLATKLDIESLRREIAESKTDIIKWCVGSVFGAVGLFATIIKLLG